MTENPANLITQLAAREGRGVKLIERRRYLIPRPELTYQQRAKLPDSKRYTPWVEEEVTGIVRKVEQDDGAWYVDLATPGIPGLAARTTTRVYLSSIVEVE
jgi:exosome complex RNA-binding protein Rrp4